MRVYSNEFVCQQGEFEVPEFNAQALPRTASACFGQTKLVALRRGSASPCHLPRWQRQGLVAIFG
jgi:hypothetical protein